jgi:hypothetical protein
MALEKSSDPKIRKNVSLRASVIKTGEALAGTLHKNSFSQLLEDLVVDAQKRQASGGEKSLEQYLIQIVDLLEKNKALEAKIEERAERFKLERKGLQEALDLCEEDLKKAKTPST